MIRRITLPIVAALALIAAILAIGCTAANAGAPNLYTLKHAPTFDAKLRPGGSVTIDDQCQRGKRHGYFSDVHAYSARTGDPLGAQRWNRDGDRTYWRARTGRVVFDGITFYNRTRHAVIVAGWCE